MRVSKIHKAALLNFTTMKLEKELYIDGANINCLIDFSYFKEDGEVTINIESIKNGQIEVSDFISEDDMEGIKWKCQVHYESTAFEYWEQRYEERNSGLSRES